MPQMSPMNWLPLMLIFSAILIFIGIINYSILKQSPKNFLIQKIDSFKTWKW
uniref:ATP synthase F0 subunit 8 n=1 Tax=Macrodorcas seguyi TaxID=618109 RepID=A0A344AUZ2_9SCAR|nr:ATP synthase F0 subunit 8 [Macrodorcas seguyi]AWX65989.1 ATP synthase F0 subunit 8 [Macrodorcas seguyi]QDH52450.1 ATP synthase F0 subunit 8 [Macrodorcas seguyi]